MGAGPEEVIESAGESRFLVMLSLIPFPFYLADIFSDAEGTVYPGTESFPLVESDDGWARSRMENAAAVLLKSMAAC
jgi:hypothetical protein